MWQRLGLRLQSVAADSVATPTRSCTAACRSIDVRPDGPAGKAGIQRGDILVGLHQWEMLTQDNVLFVLNHPDLATFNPLQFYILRNGQVHRGTVTAE